MPQLNTAIYYHEYSWLFFTFFAFYFIFLKYLLPSLIRWVKLENNSLVYHLDLLNNLDLLIEQSNISTVSKKLYKLLLTSNLIQALPYIYNTRLSGGLKTSASERTLLTLFNKYNK